MDQRAHLRLRQARIADAQRAHTLGESIDECSGDIRMHENPLHGNADLSRMIVAALYERLDDATDIGAAIDDDRCGAAVFERAACSGRELAAQIPADARR